MITKYWFLISLFLALSILPSLRANENSSKAPLYYFKLGGTSIPGDSRTILPLPTVGLGIRFQKDSHGFDLSATLGSLLFFNYFSLKGLFLFYPQSEKTQRFYLGCGPGIGYCLSACSMGSPRVNASTEYGLLNFEGVLGYEFKCSRHFKTFVQFEISQPLLHIDGHSHYTPGVGFSVGMCFGTF